MFYQTKKSVLSTLVLAQICLSTSVHAPIVTVSLLSGESILEKEFGDDISIAQLTKSVEKEFRFHGDLSVNESGILITEDTRLREIAHDGQVSFTFVKNTLKHILSGHHTIGVRAIRIDGQEQYTLVLKGSDLCEEIDMTALRNFAHTIRVIQRLNPWLKEGLEIATQTFTEATMILQSLLSDGMNSNTMELVRSLDCFKATNEYIAISGKSAYEMAIKEIHALEFVISQVAQKDPAEARPLQESINWIKHELDSRNTNNDLVNAIWFVFKRTKVLKDIYNLVELYFLLCLSEELLDIDGAVLEHSHLEGDTDYEDYKRMCESISEFRDNRLNQYYLELQNNNNSFGSYFMDIRLPIEFLEYKEYKNEFDICNGLFQLITQLSRT